MHKVLNFGSALQAYATLEAFRRLGTDAELIDYNYIPPKRSIAQASHPSSTVKRTGLCELLSKIKARLRWQWTLLRKQDKKSRFEKFWKEHFRCSNKFYATAYELSMDPPDYDLYVVGSDQVWNEQFNGMDLNWMLRFADIGARKISYASSFGNSELKPQTVEIYRQELSRFQSISVRESSGVELLKSMGLGGQQVLDPTLLLTRDEWLRAFPVKAPSRPFILVYLLGYSFNPAPFSDVVVERAHRELGHDIVSIGSVTPASVAGRPQQHLSQIGPLEFLQYFGTASFVITNSFHGTAFAANFGIPFVTITDPNAGNKDSRLANFLEAIKGLDHRINSDHDLSEDYATISPIPLEHLECQRERSIAFLRNSLNAT